MKLALVTPVYKGKSELEVCNYIPVSILPISSKVLDKTMLKRLTGFLEKSKIIYEHQFGFQKNKSTTYAVLDIYTEIVNSLDNHDLACSVFLDFAKAFNIIEHKILISKLENYGLKGTLLQWFESYLSNREQVVKIGNVLSKKRFISCGIPQGSILG